MAISLRTLARQPDFRRSARIDQYGKFSVCAKCLITVSSEKDWQSLQIFGTCTSCHKISFITLSSNYCTNYPAWNKSLCIKVTNFKVEIKESNSLSLSLSLSLSQCFCEDESFIQWITNRFSPLQKISSRIKKNWNTISETNEYRSSCLSPH